MMKYKIREEKDGNKLSRFLLIDLRIQNEIEIMKTLENENIVKFIKDSKTECGEIFFLMEICEHVVKLIIIQLTLKS